MHTPSPLFGIRPAGTYQLTSPNTAGQENGAAQGDLDLTGAGKTITIQGQGAGVTIIDGGGLDRVFQVNSGVTVILRNLTIQGGKAQDAGNAGALPGSEPGFGGGILNLGITTLDHVVVQNNVAVGGPGHNGIGLGATGATAATSGLSALGGGIFNAGVLTLTQSMVQNNTAVGGKGGQGAINTDILGVGGAGGGAIGGGIYSSGVLTVSQSTIATNHAEGGFGGDGGNNNLDEVLGNDGGNGGDAFGGGIYIADISGAVALINSTIANNDAAGGVGGQGGAGGQGGNVNTHPGSMGGNGGNGGNAKGGGIAALAPFSLYNSTVAGNSSFNSLGGQGGPGGPGSPSGFPGNAGHPGVAEAGGIWAPTDPGAPGLVTAVSSIIGGNVITVFVGSSAADEPFDVEATFANATNSLLQFADPLRRGH